MRNLFRTKGVSELIHDIENNAHTLKKTLNRWDLVALGIGAVVGAGVFTVIGTSAAGMIDASGHVLRVGAGPALVISFLLTGIASAFAAFCYAELSSLIPVSGSAYTYSYAILGEIIAWIIGWDLILEYAVAVIAVSISWSAYVVSFLKGFGIELPLWLSMDYTSFMRTLAKFPALEQTVPHIGGYAVSVNLPAIFIVAVMTTVLIIGIKESSRVNTLMVTIKLIILGFFIVTGFFYIKPINWHLPEYGFMPFGWNGVMTGAALIFFAYVGFDAVSTVAEETKNPQKDLPFGILGTLFACTILYIVVTIVLLGVVPFYELNRADPLAYAFEKINIGWASGVVAVGALIATTSVILVTLLGQSRVFFSMSRDGLIPAAFSKIHPRFRTPYISNIITGIFVALIAGFINIGEAAELTNIGTLFAFMLVCASVLVLRYRDPDRPRPFKTPFVPYVPILGILSCFYLTLNLPWLTWVRFIIWFALGLVIYMFYGYFHSTLHNRTRNFIK